MILKAFLIIFGCVFLGEVFIALTGLPLPPSVIGLIILFGALQAGVVQLDAKYHKVLYNTSSLGWIKHHDFKSIFDYFWVCVLR